MNKAKKILYATLIGLTSLASSPYEAQAKDKDKNPDAFYFTAWNDLNKDGKHQFSECENALEIKPLTAYKYISDDLFLYLNPKKGYEPVFKNLLEDGEEIGLEKIAKNSDEEIYKLTSDKIGNAYEVTINKRKMNSSLGWVRPSGKE